MKYIDTNIIIRFLMQDHDEMFERACNILNSNNNIFILNEVVAEAVFVLSSVYEIDRKDICSKLTDLLSMQRIIMHDKNLILRAFEIFGENNMDFIDCILCAVSEHNKTVVTFDKKVNKYINLNR